MRVAHILIDGVPEDPVGADPAAGPARSPKTESVSAPPPDRLGLRPPHRAATLLEMARLTGSSLELATVLQRAADGLAAAAGARHCWFYLALVEGEPGAFWASPEALPATLVAEMQPFLNRPVELPDWSPTRRAMEIRRPLTCHELPAELRINNEPPGRMGAGSALVVPLVVEERALGAAVITTLEEYREFSAAQVELAWDVAGVVAPALRNAWLHERATALAVVEERARLSREMHDSLAQALSYLNLRSVMAGDLLDQGEIAQARAGLSEVVKTAEEAYRDLRETLFCLRAKVPSGARFLPALQEYLDEYRTHFGVDVRLVVAEGSPVVFPERVGVQLSRIILEALTNVHRHAGAGRAWIRFEKEEERGRITVEDDGRGFDLSRVLESKRTHFGLQIMRERAESVGGTLDLHSRPGQGTRVVVRVPLT